MNFLEIIFLSFIQGFTEFFPVSSSGHLFLFEHFLKITDQLHFNIALHLGTVLAIITFYRSLIKKIVLNLFKSFSSNNSSVLLLYYLFISCLPTAAVGYLLLNFVKSLEKNPIVICFFLFLTALMLFSLRFINQDKNLVNESDFSDIDLSSLNTLKAFIIGLVQGISVIPGLSRSGWTICTALYLKVPAHLAAFYSFILSIPAILGACLLSFLDADLNLDQAYEIGLGVLFSYLFSLAGLYLVISVLKRNKLDYFSYYLFLVCIIFSYILF